MNKNDAAFSPWSRAVNCFCAVRFAVIQLPCPLSSSRAAQLTGQMEAVSARHTVGAAQV